MAGVSVEVSALQSAQSICTNAIEELNQSSKNLDNRYQQAGQGWRDNKYKDLGRIVGECSQALRLPLSQLSECIGKLKELERAISEYESTNL